MPGQRPHAVDGLSAQLAELTQVEGANAGPWSGLVMHRSSSPAQWVRDQDRSLSLVLVVQGRHELTVERSTFAQGPYQCLVLGGHTHMGCEVLEASFGRPYLAVVVGIDPGLVRRVSSEMLERNGPEGGHAHSAADAVPPPTWPARQSQRGYEHDLLEVVIRAGTTIASDMDRHLLAPLYQQEIVYLLLKSEQGQRVRTLAYAESANRVISSVIEYAQSHLTERLSVSEMADLAYLSTSAFAHRFREVTGRPPHQFLKEMRLEHARALLADGDLTVTQIAHEVGYASVSQFTSAFRTRFGVTPRRAATYASQPKATDMGTRSAGTG